MFHLSIRCTILYIIIGMQQHICSVGRNNVCKLKVAHTTEQQTNALEEFLQKHE